MKNQTFQFVVVVVLFAVALVGGVLLFMRGSAQSVTPRPGTQKTEPPVTAPEKTSPTLPKGETAGEGILAAALADQVGGERSGQVTVSLDPFTSETKYQISVSNLTPPQKPASYQVWVQTPEGVMGSLGTIEIGSDGNGTLETPGSTAEKNWSVVVTYQENEDPTPGKRILMGTLK